MTASAKVNIFCPIETINRELDFRLFFAALAVRPDIRFVIGKQFTISDLLQEIPGGIYLGQNIRPLRRAYVKPNLSKRLQELRANETTLLVVDEEGGVMTGDEERWKQWLDFRIDAPDLKPKEHLFTWGNWQRDYYRGLQIENAENIQTTGHPRFDLYKPQFRGFYNEETQRWREKYGDFVLINTNFAWANHFMGDKFLFSDNSYYDSTDPQKRLDFVRQWSYVGQVRSKMVALVMRLSIEMPQLNFVIRPHPSENMQSYQTIFQDAPNVYVSHEGSVGPWLLSCRALIHDGCTTALEAHFCDVPILNYKAVNDERYDLLLPNALGERCESEERVLDVLQNVMNGDTQIGKTAQLPQMATDLIHNFQHDSFAALRDYVHGVVDATAPSKAEADGVLRRHQRMEKIRPIARQLKTKLRPRQKTMVEKFYGFDGADMQRRFEKVREITGKDVRFTMLSSRVFTVEC